MWRLDQLQWMTVCSYVCVCVCVFVMLWVLCNVLVCVCMCVRARVGSCMVYCVLVASKITL